MLYAAKMLELFQRRRMWAVTGAGLLTLTLAAAWLLHRPYAGRTYRIGARTNLPYTMVAADGRVSGIAVDVVSEAARRAASCSTACVEIQMPPWAGRLK